MASIKTDGRTPEQRRSMKAAKHAARIAAEENPDSKPGLDPKEIFQERGKPRPQPGNFPRLQPGQTAPKE